LDPATNLYVADSFNNLIRKVTPSGLVTTLAGLAGTRGSADGAGSDARFYYPSGLALDNAGNFEVADSENNTIRTVTPAGVVTTLAGLAGSSGSADGTGSAARFSYPIGAAADGAGNIYVGDSENCTIRKVTLAGAVTTLAGLARNWGTLDGTGSAARFVDPSGLAVDGAGNVYVTDADADLVRKVTPAGLVTTLAGLALVPGAADGTGSAARFNRAQGVAVDDAGNVYVADSANNSLRIGTTNTCPDVPVIDLPFGPVGQLRQLDASPQTAVAWRWRPIRAPAASSAVLSDASVRNPTFTPDVADLYIFRLYTTNATGGVCIRTLAFTAGPMPPSIVEAPLPRTAEAGSCAAFWVEVTNSVPGAGGQCCQWYFDGTNALAGATNSVLVLPGVQTAQAGAYTVAVTDPYGSVTSAPVRLSVIAPVERRLVAVPNLTGSLGSVVHLECANALGPGAQWLSLSNFTLASTPQLFFDLSDPLPPQRFYRAWQTNGPPPVLRQGMAAATTLTGAIGTSIRIDCIEEIGRTDGWSTLATVVLTNSPQLYFDLTIRGHAPWLYRLVPLP